MHVFPTRRAVGWFGVRWRHKPFVCPHVKKILRKNKMLSTFSDASSIRSLHGGADKKTIRGVIISASVIFVVAVVLLLVWFAKRGEVGATSVASPVPVPLAKRFTRAAVEVKSESEADAALSGSEPAMVFVYADWCGFCKRADPIFSELASDPAYRGVKMLKLDSAKAPKFVSARGIRGFPVFLTNFGKTRKIVGFKPKEAMEEFLKEAGGAAAKAGGAAAKAKAGGVARAPGGVSESVAMDALGGDAPAVVFVGAEWCGFCKKLMPIWEDVVASGQFNGVKLLRIDAKDAPELVKQHGITGFPVLLSNKAERKYIGYRPKEKLEKILLEVQGS